MRAREIEAGREHWVRCRIEAVRKVPAALASDGHGGRGFPGVTVRRRVLVVERAPATGRYGAVVVEADVWECVNAHWFTAPGEITRAQLDGLLRWRRERRRWVVPVRQVIAPVAGRCQADAVAGRNDRTEMAS